LGTLDFSPQKPDKRAIERNENVVRTRAPKGQTPIIQFHFNWTHVAVIAGLTRTNCLFRLHEGSIKKEVQIAFLPLYAPNLNPVEYLWAWLKRQAMANYCPDNLSELQTTARNKLKSGQKRPSIIAVFWVQANLW